MKIMSDNTIGINRGDELLFDYQIYNGNDIYEFVEGDEVGFYLYKKGQYNKEPVIQAIFTPEAGEDVVEIRISAEDMDIGTLTNVPVEYWYEITLNDEVTLGYDNDGPKVLMLYPTGKKINEHHSI